MIHVTTIQAGLDGFRNLALACEQALHLRVRQSHDRSPLNQRACCLQANPVPVLFFSSPGYLKKEDLIELLHLAAIYDTDLRKYLINYKRSKLITKYAGTKICSLISKARSVQPKLQPHKELNFNSFAFKGAVSQPQRQLG